MKWATRTTRVVAPMALAVALVVVAGCGRMSAQPAPPSLTSPPVTIPPPGAASGPDPCGVVVRPGVTVSGTNGLCAVTAVLGVSFAIVLDAGFNWNDPTSDSPSVTVSAVSRDAQGRLEADLTAGRTGRATISATGGILCPPGQACPALARLWRLQVTVVP